MGSEKILVVDDGADMRDFVVEYVLQSNGYDWLVAEDGQRGLQVALSDAPDLILLDLQMPRMDGIGMLRAMQERDLAIPVVLMTFHGSEQIAVEVFRMGVVDYVIKPFNVDEMLHAIECALTASRLREERDQLTERLLASNMDLKRRVKELQTLYGVSKSLASQVDQKTLLARIVDAATYVTSADESAILLRDEASDDLRMGVVKKGSEPAHSASETCDDQTAQSVVQMTEFRSILVSRGADQSPAQNVLYVPVVSGDSALGVLRVTSQLALGEHQTQLLNALADYAAIGLQRA